MPVLSMNRKLEQNNSFNVKADNDKVGGRNEVKSSTNPNVLIGLAKKGWLPVLSDSAIKILIYFSDLQECNMELVARYDVIIDKTGLGRSSVSVGLKELTAFAFINEKKKYGKTIVYEMTKVVPCLTNEWIRCLTDKEYKSTLIDILLNAKVSQSSLEKVSVRAINDRNEAARNVRVAIENYLSNRKVTTKMLFDKEMFDMADEIMYTSDWGFGDPVDNTQRDESILSEADRKDKALMEIIEVFEMFVGPITLKDVTAIKKARTVCYPSQIKSAIRRVSDKQGAKFKSMNYILPQLLKGVYGKKQPKKDKNAEVKNSANRPKNNQTDFGHKMSNLDRKEKIAILTEAAKDNKDGFFDFNTLL